MSIKGSPELTKRLKAIGQAFKPYGKTWAEEVVAIVKPKLPVRTGRLRASPRVTHATARRATVGAYYTAYFWSGGARYASRRSGRTIFQRQGFRLKPHPFRVAAQLEALKRHPISHTILDAWNKAA